MNPQLRDPPIYKLFCLNQKQKGPGPHETDKKERHLNITFISNWPIDKVIVYAKINNIDAELIKEDSQRRKPLYTKILPLIRKC